MATRSTNTDGQGGLPDAVVEDLLSDESRRIALSVLAERDEPVVVESLATAVVATEEGCSEPDVSTAQREGMREELFTEHIPKLMATDVVAYDSMLGTVELKKPDIIQGRF